MGSRRIFYCVWTLSFQKFEQTIFWFSHISKIFSLNFLSLEVWAYNSERSVHKFYFHTFVSNRTSTSSENYKIAPQRALMWKHHLKNFHWFFKFLELCGVHLYSVGFHIVQSLVELMKICVCIPIPFSKLKTVFKTVEVAR